MFKESQPIPERNRVEILANQRNWNVYLLEMASKIKDEQINGFQRKVVPEFQQLFEEKTRDQKKILVALDNLTEKERGALETHLEEAKREMKRNTHYMVAIHDVAENFLVLDLCTGRRKTKL